jgi:hypothetical protein
MKAAQNLTSRQTLPGLGMLLVELDQVEGEEALIKLSFDPMSIAEF